MPQSYSSEAVVLRWRSYGESDKIVTFLTRDFGKITGIGKGAKNSRRRFPNSLEVLARVQVQFRQRQEATLAFLETCELRNPGAAAMNPDRLAYGAYLTELAEQMTVEWNPAPEIYELLDLALRSIEARPATSSFLRAYELKLLDHAGFATPLDHCNECGRPLDDDAVAFFGPIWGGFWCRPCSTSREGMVEVPARLLGRLRALRSDPLTTAPGRSLGDDQEQAAQLTGQLLALHLIRPLQSVRAIEQLARGRS